MSNNNNGKLDQKVEDCRWRLSHCPSWSPNFLRQAFVMHLSHALYDRFEQLGGIEYLDESITYYRQALDLCPIRSSYRSLCFNNLGSFVGNRYARLNRIEDLEEAIACHRQALDLRPHGHPSRSMSLSNLASLLTNRFNHLGRMEDLEMGITYHRQALALLSRGHPDRSYSLHGLATALRTYFDQLGRMEDLEGAITSYHDALALRPPGHPDHSSSLSGLANAFSTRFDKLGRMEDLEVAITYLRQALALQSFGEPNYLDVLHKLGGALVKRFRQSGSMEDLEEAITCHRQVLALQPHKHPSRGNFLNHLASNLGHRFEQLGRMEDLEEAITYHREALALLPHGHPHHYHVLNNLGRSLSVRFHHLGRMEDLEDAITYSRQSLAVQSHGHPNYPTFLNGLAFDLSNRFMQLGNIDDLEEAITCFHQALALKSHGHPTRSSTLHDLAHAVAVRFEQLGRIEDLEEVIMYYRQALALIPHGHPNRSSTLHGLALAACARFKQSSSKDDLLDAFKYLSEGKNLLPTGHPNQSRFKLHLASVLLVQCENSSKLDERLHMMTKAFDLLEDAANHSSASAKDRFDAAVRWAKEAHSREHQSVVHAYTKSLTLLDHRLVLTPTIESQQKLLATAPKGLALDAASSSINRGELRSAVELLEQGRAVLWSKLRGYRHPLDKLRTLDKELFDQFGTISGQLECLAMSVEPGLSASSESNTEQPFGSSFEAKMQQHRILSENWDDVVDKIRQVDGFTDFLRAVPFATLQTAAAEGPIIIINISQYRSDAIILQDVGDPVIVPLPETLPIILTQLSSQFATACASHGKDSAKLILPILRSLWDNIALPVRNQLVALGVPDKSRIWWCPTSHLCGLPLHAAGKYSSKVAKPNSIPDCYVSSYTPSLSALIKARSGLVTRTTNPNLLVVAQPDETLPKVKEEIGHIQRLLNNANILEGPDANHDTVLSGLRTHSWVHFACHGHLNNQPFHSSFQLHDHSRLKLVKLIPTQFSNAELAFLSACHTAAGDAVGTPDEVVHLAAALQFCGFRSVVGTLWAMEDDDGCDVTKDFYRYMFRTPGAVPNFKDSAEALHQATREMRKRGLGLDRWVKFVHVGA